MGYDFKKIKDKIKGAAKTNKNPKELAEEALFVAFWIFAVILIAIAVLDLWLNLTPCFRLFTGDLDSARYLLSAIAQAQAAIIALVVTLTLVAVQLASQSYSPRVMDLFRSFRNYPFWLLLLLYFVSIMYDVVILGTLNKEMNELPVNRISFAVFLMGFAIAALVPYTRNVINNLKPENVAAQLAKNVGVKNFKEDTHFISLIHMIKRAMRDDDITTACVGIQQIGEVYMKCADEIKKEDEHRELLEKFFYDLYRINEIVLNKKEEDYAIEIIKVVGLMEVTTIEKEFVYREHPPSTVDHFLTLSRLYDKLDFKVTIYLIMEYLRDTGRYSAYKRFRGETVLAFIYAIKEIIKDSKCIYGIFISKEDHINNFLLPIIIAILENKEGSRIFFYNDNIMGEEYKDKDEISLIFDKIVLPIINDLKKCYESIPGDSFSYNLVIRICALGTHFVHSKQDTKDLILILMKMSCEECIETIEDYEKYLKREVHTRIIEQDIFFPEDAKISINKEKIEAFQEFKKRYEHALIYNLCKKGVEYVQKKEEIKYLINLLDKIHKSSREVFENSIEDYESNLKKEGDKSKLKAFQEFKKQLTFLKEKS